MPAGRTANWVLGNHDNWRLGKWMDMEIEGRGLELSSNLQI
jgi:hypothetical protein